MGKKGADGGKKKGGGKRPADLPEGFETYAEYMKKELKDRFVGLCKEAGTEVPQALVKYMDALLEEDKLLSSAVASGRGFSAAALQALVAVLQQWSALRTLCVWRSTAGDEAAALCAELLKVNPSVTALELLDVGLTARGAHLLGDALCHPGGNCTLKYLLLDYNALGDAGAAQLAAGLRGNGDLATLSLRYCGIGPDGAAALAQSALPSMRLAYLRLRGNRIGDAGACALAETVGRAAKLRELDVLDNAITLPGCRALVAAVARNPSIELLDMDANPVTDAGGQEVVRALQHRKAMLDRAADAPPPAARDSDADAAAAATDGAAEPPPPPAPLSITVTERLTRETIAALKEARDAIAPPKKGKKGKKK